MNVKHEICSCKYIYIYIYIYTYIYVSYIFKKFDILKEKILNCIYNCI